MIAAELETEFFDADGYLWLQDSVTETWDCPDLDVFCVPTVWLLEHRAVSG